MGSGTTQDHGDADPRLTQALEAGDAVAIRQAMLAVRLLVPIVAVGEESDAVEMAVPRIVNAEGRTALPVFSSYEALRAWRPQGRPVPMPGEQAVAAALAEGYDALVLDIAGPIPHTVEIRRPS
jgi:SseB protein N-terminal domain